MTSSSHTFMDNRTFKVGTRVSFMAVVKKDYVERTGTVIGFDESARLVSVKVMPDDIQELYGSEVWILKDGGDFCKMRDYGLGAGSFNIISETVGA